MTNISLKSNPAADRIRIKAILGFRKLSTLNRLVLEDLANGKPVSLSEAERAVFGAMRCAVTANGQSMGRRQDAEAVQAAWDVVRAADDTTDAASAVADKVVADADKRVKAAEARVVEAQRIVEQVKIVAREALDNATEWQRVAQTRDANAVDPKVWTYVVAEMLTDAQVSHVEGFIAGLKR